MKDYFVSFWNYLEKLSVHEIDSPNEKRRRMTLVMIAILCCLVGILVGTRDLIIAGINSAVVIPYTFTALVGIALIVYFMNKKFNLLLYSFLFTILIIPVLFQWSVGGFSSRSAISLIFWALLAPFGSLMFQDIKKANWWFIAFIGLVIISLSLDKNFAQYSLKGPHSELMVSHGINIIGFSITIFITMRYFVHAFQREHSRAEKLVLELTKTNGELHATLMELKETQTELVQTEKMAALGKLAASIAHEMNNPIGALKSSADLSARCVSKMEKYFNDHKGLTEVENDTAFRNFVQILKDNSHVLTSASDRVATTVGGFISFARLDEAEFDKVDIHQGIENTLSLIQRETKEDINIVKKYGEIPKISCYPAELNQVFMNLLTNAVHSIKGKGKITIHTFLENEKVHVKIVDTGVGIPQEKIKHLFDPRITRHGIRVKALLGLFTNFNIIKKHNGTMKVESEIGKGSTFTIILPTDFEKVEKL